MFLSNKYAIWYHELIERAVKDARKRSDEIYLESHHIIPKSLGGSNEKTNLVLLTTREHFVAHRLLVKITSGENRRKMCFALYRLTHSGGNLKRNFTSHQYDVAKRLRIIAVKEAQTGRKRSQETKDKISASRQANPIKFTDEYRENMRQKITGKKRTEETKRNMSEARKRFIEANPGFKTCISQTEEAKKKIKHATWRSWNDPTYEGYRR